MQTSQREMTEAPSEAESKLTTKKQDCISHYLLLIIVVITKGEKKLKKTKKYKKITYSINTKKYFLFILTTFRDPDPNL